MNLPIALPFTPCLHAYMPTLSNPHPASLPSASIWPLAQRSPEASVIIQLFLAIRRLIMPWLTHPNPWSASASDPIGTGPQPQPMSWAGDLIPQVSIDEGECSYFIVPWGTQLLRAISAQGCYEAG